MINYQHLVDAENYYRDCGFTRVEAPWSVARPFVSVTAPENATLYPHDDRYLVASGEQSLLSMQLSPGRYMCITPCFRDDSDDGLHKPYFVKLELFDNFNPTMESLLDILDMCHNFFPHYLPCKTLKVDPDKGDTLAKAASTYDIVSLSGIELGSYGVRDHPKLGSWVYATGCAEPRLSKTIEMSYGQD